MLSERELESRYEVFVEQYVDSSSTSRRETAAAIARTMILPAAVRHLDRAQGGGHRVADRARPSALVDELVTAIVALEKANATTRPRRASSTPSTCATRCIPAMEAVREVADKLERIVADDLWPLPKYSEMLFIK